MSPSAARLATARSPPPGRWRPGGHCPAPPAAWWRIPPWERLPDRGPLEHRVAERSILVCGLPVQHRLVQPSSQQVDADLSISSVTKRKTSSPGAVHRSRRPARRCRRQVRRPSNRSRCASEVLLGNGSDSPTAGRRRTHRGWRYRANVAGYGTSSGVIHARAIMPRPPPDYRLTAVAGRTTASRAHSPTRTRIVAEAGQQLPKGTGRVIAERHRR